MIARISSGSSRADSAVEIAEHDRQLAALGAVQRFLRWPGGHLVRGRSGDGKLTDRPQDPQSVPKRDAKILEVLIGQLRQNISLDFTFAKSSLILAQPKAAQPVSTSIVAFPQWPLNRLRLGCD